MIEKVLTTIEKVGTDLVSKFHQEPQAGLIYKKISELMCAVEAIEKTKKQGAQVSYAYRGIDDVYSELHPLMAKLGIFTAPEVLESQREERSSKAGNMLMYTILRVRFRFYCEDGSNVQVVTVGEAMDTSDKSSNKAMSIAHKYALVMILCIPTKDDEKDPDYSKHEVKGKPKDGPQPGTPPSAPPQAAKAPPPAKDGPITEPQRKRLFAGAKDFGWSPDDIKAYLGIDHGLSSTKDIPKSKYETICDYISKNPIKK